MGEKDNDKPSRLRRWSAIETAYQNRTPLRARILDIAEGKVSVDVDGFPGIIEKFLWAFTVPASEGFTDKNANLRRLQTLKGEVVMLRIVDIDHHRECLKLSQKLYSDDAEENARQHAFVFEKLQPGDVCPGIILSLNDHLATVYLDGATGKLPVFHLIDPEGKSMHTNPLKVGQEISVVISKKERRTLWLELVSS